MQHRYTGDIGDFAKYGLLRALGGRVRLGVAWYLYPDENHNGDGKHIPYLDKPEKWRHLDPDLFDTLKAIIDNGTRSVAQVEQSGLLGEAIFSGAMLDFTGSPAQRRQQRSDWFITMQRDLIHCDVVFTDPDNGLCLDEKYRLGQRKFWKRMPLSEVFALTQDRTGILYHHNAMYPGGHLKEIHYWLSESPRVWWRLQSLREWSHEQIQPFFP